MEKEEEHDGSYSALILLGAVGIGGELGDNLKYDETKAIHLRGLTISIRLLHSVGHRPYSFTRKGGGRGWMRTRKRKRRRRRRRR